MRILDVTAGNRAIWFNKEHPMTTYVDIRPEVSPGIVANSMNLPVSAGRDFDLVVFDPPHVNFGKNGNMTKNYGHWTTSEIKELVLGVALEAHRVTKANALMAFKWNDHDTRLAAVLDLMAPWWEPLFGQVTSTRTTRLSTTCWVQLRRIDNPIPPGSEEK